MSDDPRNPPEDDSQVQAERRAKLSLLRKSGNPFPNDFSREHFAQALHATYSDVEKEALEAGAVRVAVAGRMMLKRVMGKASFATIQDSSGRIQLYIADDSTGREVHAAWRRERAELIDVYRTLDPKVRVEWYGPPMSPASKITARIMETWAHGEDVADTLGVTREPTDRLRHVAHIGVGARRFSYATNGRDTDDTAVFVELVAPSGAVWAWGDPAAAPRE